MTGTVNLTRTHAVTFLSGLACLVMCVGVHRQSWITTYHKTHTTHHKPPTARTAYYTNHTPHTTQTTHHTPHTQEGGFKLNGDLGGRVGKVEHVLGFALCREAEVGGVLDGDKVRRSSGWWRRGWFARSRGHMLSEGKHESV
jgi:hypothetical protein